MSELTDERLAEIRRMYELVPTLDPGDPVRIELANVLFGVSLPDLLAEVERLKAKLAARISWLAKEDQAHEVTIVERDQLKARINADAQYIAEVIAEREKARTELAQLREDAKTQGDFLRAENEAKREVLTDLVLAVDCLRCGRIKASEVHLLTWDSPHGDESCRKCGSGVEIRERDVLAELEERDQLHARVAELERDHATAIGFARQLVFDGSTICRVGCVIKTRKAEP